MNGFPIHPEITDSEIRELSREAARHGDHEMVEICRTALGSHQVIDTSGDDSAIRAAVRAARQAAEVQQARARCAEVLADAAAASRSRS